MHSDKTQSQTVTLTMAMEMRTAAMCIGSLLALLDSAAVGVCGGVMLIWILARIPRRSGILMREGLDMASVLSSDANTEVWCGCEDRGKRYNLRCGRILQSP